MMNEREKRQKKSRAQIEQTKTNEETNKQNKEMNKQKKENLLFIIENLI